MTNLYIKTSTVSSRQSKLVINNKREWPNKVEKKYQTKTNKQTNKQT